MLYFIIPNITYQAMKAPALAFNSQHYFTLSLPSFLFSNYKDLLCLLWIPLIFLRLPSCGSPFKICSSHNSVFNWQSLLLRGVQISLLCRSFHYLVSPYLSRHHFVIYFIGLILSISTWFTYFLWDLICFVSDTNQTLWHHYWNIADAQEIFLKWADEYIIINT